MSYPCEDADKNAQYDHYIEEAKILFNEFTTSNRPNVDGQFTQGGFRQNLHAELRGPFGAGSNPNTNNNNSGSYKLNTQVAEKTKAGDLISHGN